MRKLSIGLRVVVGLIFLFQGGAKLAGAADEWRDDLQVAPWFWILIGVVQVVGALGLFASIRYEQFALPVGALFVVMMAGALVTHVRVSDPISEMIFPAVVLLLSALIAVLAYRQTGFFEPSYSGDTETGTF